VAQRQDRLEDRVADNLTFHDMTESESLLAGTGVGVVTDIETGPDGHPYVVSLSQGRGVRDQRLALTPGTRGRPIIAACRNRRRASSCAVKTC
jgi:hypothetical protein